MRAGMTRWGEGRVSRTRAGGLGLVAEVRVGGGRLGKIRGGDFGGGGRGRAPGGGGGWRTWGGESWGCNHDLEMSGEGFGGLGIAYLQFSASYSIGKNDPQSLVPFIRIMLNETCMRFSRGILIHSDKLFLLLPRTFSP